MNSRRRYNLRRREGQEIHHLSDNEKSQSFHGRRSKRKRDELYQQHESSPIKRQSLHSRRSKRKRDELYQQNESSPIKRQSLHSRRKRQREDIVATDFFDEAENLSTAPRFALHQEIPAAEKEEAIQPKRKRRRRKDPAWSNRGSRKRRKGQQGQHIDILRMRMDNTTKITDDNASSETKQQIKTAVLIKFDDLKLNPAISPGQLEKQFEENISAQAIPSARQVASIQYSEKGSPIIVQTPGGTQLARTENYGFMHCFDNRNQSPYRSPEALQVSEDSDFFKSAEYQAIRKYEDEFKEHEQEISKKLREKVQKENRNNNNRRTVSQNKVMVEEGVNARLGSATQYATKSELFPNLLEINMKWEWLHLIAYAILGKESQDAKNLVCGTTHANSSMLLPESLIGRISEAYPNGFILQIKAEMIKGTQFGQKLSYVITTKDFALPFKFDLNAKTKPHYHYYLYLKSFVEAILTIVNNLSKGKLSEDVSATTTTTTTTTPLTISPTTTTTTTTSNDANLEPRKQTLSPVICKTEAVQSRFFKRKTANENISLQPVNTPYKKNTSPLRKIANDEHKENVPPINASEKEADDIPVKKSARRSLF